MIPDSLQLLVNGILLGFSIAAPVGSIGVLCIRRTLAYGSPSGLVSGLGAASPAEKAAEVQMTTRTGLLGFYLLTLFLTLTNPMTILSFVAIFVEAGVASAGNSLGGAAVTVLGVFLGSAAWWLLLTFGVGIFRERFNQRWQLWVNRFSGVIIIGFALVVLLT